MSYKKRIAEILQELHDLQKELEHLQELAAKPTFSIGDKFSNARHTTMLVAVGPLKVILVCLDTGARYSEPVDVQDIFAITEEELKKCTSDSDWCTWQPVKMQAGTYAWGV